MRITYHFPAGVNAERDVEEREGCAIVRTGNDWFDGLYALAIEEAVQNSVDSIKDDAYNNGCPIQLKAFATGAKWHYVWTRDVAYAVHLALAQFDPGRAAASLLFKTGGLKAGVKGGFANQIVQDTGTGGSYPISTDRVVWMIGAIELLDYLAPDERKAFIQRVYPFAVDTINQDRLLVFDPADGLYRGEQSFLDWREQTYPRWTSKSVLPIGMSKAFGTNIAHYYFLKKSAWLARTLGEDEEADRFGEWAAELRDRIRTEFRDPESDLHAAYLLSDGGTQTRTARRDLLAESLAILFDVTEPGEAEQIIKSYPTGPHGPPVTWPQERSVPIYHNNGIWPFVTAYWMLAAKKAGNAAAVANAVCSLFDGAALNLSNMENLDFVTGKPDAESHGIAGPVINSQRQLWSIAGYLAMVQKVVFGLETGPGGIRFDPYIPRQIRDRFFSGRDVLALRGLPYRGRDINVHLHLPPRQEGVCRLERVELNGKPWENVFVHAENLDRVNEWDLFLRDEPPSSTSIQLVDTDDARAIFGPAQPEWDDPAITESSGRLTLRYRPGCDTEVEFTIYRNGKQVAQGAAETHWTDPDSADFKDRRYFYTVAAVDASSRNVSHLAPSRSFSEMEDAEYIDVESTFRPKRAGRYRIRVKYGNGSGPVNTGIACGVKRLDIAPESGNDPVASEYLVLPQLGENDWELREWSSPMVARLASESTYAFRITEDEISRNMSYLENNRAYTAFPGGGPRPCNEARIAAIEILHLGT